MSTDREPRAPGCVCTWEQGDSDCPVHPTCPECGESLATAAINRHVIAARSTIATMQQQLDVLRLERDQARVEVERLKTSCQAARSMAFAMLPLVDAALSWSAAGGRSNSDARLDAVVAAYLAAHPSPQAGTVKP